MAIEIVETPSSPDANSYASLDEAEEYFSLRSPEAINWAAATSEDAKARALLTATRLMDTLIDWDGSVTDEEQALAWPRQALEDANGSELDPAEIPDEVKWAQFEFAEVLLSTDRTADLATAGIKSIDAGVSIEFMDTAPPVRAVIPDIVWDFVRRWGHRRDVSSGMATIIRG